MLNLFLDCYPHVVHVPELQICWISAAITAVGGLLSSIFNNKSANEQTYQNAEHNYDIWNREFQQQNQRQDYLNSNAQSIYANSMRQAGFNPLWTGQGGVASTSVSSPSVSPGNPGRGALEGFDASQLGSIYKSFEEGKLIKQEARKAKEEADRLARENKNNRDFDLMLGQNNFSREMLTNLYGEEWYESNANSSLSLDDNPNGEGSVNIPISVGRLNAYNVLRDIGVVDSDRSTKMSENDARQIVAEVNKRIAEYKVDHPNTIKAEAEISVQEFYKVQQEVKNLFKQGILLNDDHDIKVNEKKLQELDIKDASFNNISALYDKICNNKDASVLDKICTTLGFIFNKAFAYKMSSRH